MKKGYITLFVLIMVSVLLIFAISSTKKSNHFIRESKDRVQSFENYYETEEVLYHLPEDKAFKDKLVFEVDKYTNNYSLNDISNNKSFLNNFAFYLNDSKDRSIDSIKDMRGMFELNEAQDDLILKVFYTNSKEEGRETLVAYYSLFSSKINNFLNKEYNSCIMIDKDFMAKLIQGLDDRYEEVYKTPYNYSNIKSLSLDKTYNTSHINKYTDSCLKGYKHTHNYMKPKFFINTSETSEGTDIYLVNKYPNNRSFYSGIITTNGNVYIDGKIRFEGIILLNGGDLHIMPGSDLVVNGLFLSTSAQEANFIHLTSLKHVLIYGLLMEELFEVELENVSNFKYDNGGKK